VFFFFFFFGGPVPQRSDMQRDLLLQFIAESKKGLFERSTPISPQL